MALPFTRPEFLQVFADYNTRLNVLMVVLKSGHGTCWAIPSAINEMVPEALLVAQPRF